MRHRNFSFQIKVRQGEGERRSTLERTPAAKRWHCVRICVRNATAYAFAKRWQCSPVSSLQSPEREARTERLRTPTTIEVDTPPRCPEDFEPDRTFALRELPDIDVERELGKFRDCEFPKTHSDWPAVWRNWIRRAKDSGKYARTAGDRASISNPDGTLNPRALT